MEDLNNTREDQSPTANLQSVAANSQQPPPDSTFINIDSPRRTTQIVIGDTTQTTPRPQLLNGSPLPAQFHNYPGILYLVYAAALLYMFPSMIALVELKFQNNARSVFETNRVFANLAVVAYITAIPTSVALFCLKAGLESSNMESLAPIRFRILQSVFYFSSLLAPLSFVLVLFLPHGFDALGYSLVFTLFLIIVACSFSNYVCKKDTLNVNLEAVRRNEISSHRASTFSGV